MLMVLYWCGKTNIMKAKEIVRHKAEIQERYIIELVAHEIGRSKRYPQAIKYSLICFDKNTKKKILMDNHHPKGHHIHLDGEEIFYKFTTWEKLIVDFEKLVLDNMGVKL